MLESKPRSIMIIKQVSFEYTNLFSFEYMKLLVLTQFVGSVENISLKRCSRTYK